MELKNRAAKKSAPSFSVGDGSNGLAGKSWPARGYAANTMFRSDSTQSSAMVRKSSPNLPPPVLHDKSTEVLEVLLSSSSAESGRSTPSRHDGYYESSGPGRASRKWPTALATTSSESSASAGITQTTDGREFPAESELPEPAGDMSDGPQRAEGTLSASESPSAFSADFNLALLERMIRQQEGHQNETRGQGSAATTTTEARSPERLEGSIKTKGRLQRSPRLGRSPRLAEPHQPLASSRLSIPSRNLDESLPAKQDIGVRRERAPVAGSELRRRFRGVGTLFDARGSQQRQGDVEAALPPEVTIGKETMQVSPARTEASQISSLEKSAQQLRLAMSEAQSMMPPVASKPRFAAGPQQRPDSLGTYDVRRQGEYLRADQLPTIITPLYRSRSPPSRRVERPRRHLSWTSPTCSAVLFPNVDLLEYVRKAQAVSRLIFQHPRLVPTEKRELAVQLWGLLLDLEPSELRQLAPRIIQAVEKQARQSEANLESDRGMAGPRPSVPTDHAAVQQKLMPATSPILASRRLQELRSKRLARLKETGLPEAESLTPLREGEMGQPGDINSSEAASSVAESDEEARARKLRKLRGGRSHKVTSYDLMRDDESRPNVEAEPAGETGSARRRRQNGEGRAPQQGVREAADASWVSPEGLMAGGGAPQSETTGKGPASMTAGAHRLQAIFSLQSESEGDENQLSLMAGGRSREGLRPGGSTALNIPVGFDPQKEEKEMNRRLRKRRAIRYVRADRKRGVWDSDELRLLIDLVNQYRPGNWVAIDKSIPAALNRDITQIKEKWVQLMGSRQIGRDEFGRYYIWRPGDPYAELQ